MGKCFELFGFLLFDEEENLIEFFKYFLILFRKIGGYGVVEDFDVFFKVVFIFSMYVKLFFYSVKRMLYF